MASQISDKTLLKSFANIYERIVKKALKSFEAKDYEKALIIIRTAADLASQFHPGRFSDARIEKMALQIGEILEILVGNKTSLRQAILPEKKTDRKRVLHLASILYEVGGHTRLINNWIKNDDDKEHWLIATSQESEKIPAWLTKAFEENGGRVIGLSENYSPLERSLFVREFSQSFDYVILHQHQWDLIPLLAFAVEQSPPVAVMNHADHCFWLGVSVADLVLDLRDYGSQLTLNRRKARQSKVLPICLEEITAELPSRLEARQQLYIAKDKVVVLSMGTEFKYSPVKEHNFFRTVVKILESNPTAEMYVIGPQYDEKKYDYHERLHYLGVISDPILYEIAADIYLEGFPVGSFTALLETVRLGVCPVLMYSPNKLFAFTNESAVKDCGERAVDEADYVQKVSELITSAEKRTRIAEATKKNVAHYHSGKAWRVTLNEAYNYLETAGHRPQLVEATKSQSKEDDLALVSLKNEYFQSQDKPPQLLIFQKSKLHKILSSTDTLTFFIGALSDKDIKSIADLRSWLGKLRSWV